MNKSIPTVQRYMTMGAVTVEPTASIKQAAALMKKHRIRHLPVVKGERLVGIVSDRDLAMAANTTGVNAATEPVKSAMTRAPLTVSPDAPLDQVAFDMADARSESAVVLENVKVIGVLTTVDLCRALGEVLRSR